MILLLAYGNPLRQDDGAGLRLAEQMADYWQSTGMPLRHLAVQQLAPELAVEIAQPGVLAVVFVDARVDAPDSVPDGVVVAALRSDGPSSPSLGHHTQPDVLLAYAALLLNGRPAPPAWLVTVPGVNFEHGEGLSQVASAAIEAAFSQRDHALVRLLERLGQSAV